MAPHLPSVSLSLISPPSTTDSLSRMATRTHIALKKTALPKGCIDRTDVGNRLRYVQRDQTAIVDRGRDIQLYASIFVGD